MKKAILMAVLVLLGGAAALADTVTIVNIKAESVPPWNKMKTCAGV